MKTGMLGLAMTCALATPMLAGAADAGTVRMIYGGRETPVVQEAQLSGCVKIVTRGIVAPEATVSRELSEQPVRTDLIEVQLAGMTTYIDPARDYIHEGLNNFDDNNVLARTVRQYRAMHGNQVKMILGSEARMSDRPMPQPLFVIERPTPQPFKKFNPIPNKPQAPKACATPQVANATP